MDGDDRLEPTWAIIKKMHGFMSKIRMFEEIDHAHGSRGALGERAYPSLRALRRLFRRFLWRAALLAWMMPLPTMESMTGLASS